MKKAVFFGFSVILAMGCRGKLGLQSPPIIFDRYGGLEGHQGHNSSGYFRVELIGSRWWFVDPENNLFYSLGADTTEPNGDVSPTLGYPPYGHNTQALFAGDIRGWVNRTISRYSLLGFNTLGSWSDYTVFQGTIPYAVNLSLGSTASGQCPTMSSGWWTNFPDVFDPCFLQKTAESAKGGITDSMKSDPYLIGYFTDNELSWWGDKAWWYNPDHTLADDAIGLTATSSAKQYWVNTFLRVAKGYSLPALNAAYGKGFTDWSDVLNITSLPNNASYPAIQRDKDDFIGAIAEAYFSGTTLAIREGGGDTNHLILGCRFATLAPDPVIRAAGRYADAISVNDYFTEGDAATNPLFGLPMERWTWMYFLTHRPFILSEFGRRAMDSGLPNTWGAPFSSVATQADRAAYYRATVASLSGLVSEGVNFVVGFHWFEWRDEPALGRFDGENSNYGVVNIKDEVYSTLAASMRNTVDSLYRKLLNITVKVLPPPSVISPAPGAILQDPRPVLSWSSVSGASSYTLLYSPDRTFPDGITLTKIFMGTSSPPDVGLAQGQWWWTVKADPINGIPSDYANPASFVVSQPIQNPARCMDFDDLSCWHMEWPSAQPDRSDGAAAILPEDRITTWGGHSGKMAFTINSNGSNNKVNGGSGGTVSLSWSPSPLLDVTSKSSLSFDILPPLVVTPSGALMTGLTFLRLRIEDSAGTAITDASLDPARTAAAGKWSTISIPLSGTQSISKIIFYMDINDTDIPLDERMNFFVDSLR